MWKRIQEIAGDAKAKAQDYAGAVAKTASNAATAANIISPIKQNGRNRRFNDRYHHYGNNLKDPFCKILMTLPQEKNWEATIMNWLPPGEVSYEMQGCEECGCVSLQSQPAHGYLICQGAFEPCGVGPLISSAIAQHSHIKGAIVCTIKLFKDNDYALSAEQYIKVAREALKTNQWSLIKLFDWRWFFKILSVPNRSEQSRDIRIKQYIEHYAFRVLCEVFESVGPKGELQDLANIEEILETLFPKKADYADAWKQCEPVLNPIRRDASSADFMRILCSPNLSGIRKVLVKEYGILWRPFSSQITEHDRNIIEGAFKYVMREYLGSYELEQRHWVRIIRGNTAINRSFMLLAQSFAEEIKSSHIPEMEKIRRLNSLNELLPHTPGVKPSKSWEFYVQTKLFCQYYSPCSCCRRSEKWEGESTQMVPLLDNDW